MKTLSEAGLKPLLVDTNRNNTSVLYVFNHTINTVEMWKETCIPGKNSVKYLKKFYRFYAESAPIQNLTYS